jgi:hypothetical protein
MLVKIPLNEDMAKIYEKTDSMPILAQKLRFLRAG